MKRLSRAFESAFPFLGCIFFLLLLMTCLEYVYRISEESFLSNMSMYRQAGLIIDCVFLASLLALLVWLPIYISLLLLERYQKAHRIFIFVCMFILSIVYFAVLLVHLDSVAYELTGWNVYAFPPSANIILLVILVDVGLLFVVKRGREVVDFFSNTRHRVAPLLLAIFLVSSLLQLRNAFPDSEKETYKKRGDPENPPNIILFTVDALDRRHLGIYGYEKQTTPNLQALQGKIIYSRAYCNAGDTTPSMTSLLTSKSPLTTKVFTNIGILQGKDSFQHLPSILAELGYFNVDLKLPPAESQGNLRDGFHMVNGKETSLHPSNLAITRQLKRIFALEIFFFSTTFQRYKDRILFMSGVSRNVLIPLLTPRNIAADRSPPRPIGFGELTNIILSTDDDKQVNMALEALNTIQKPVFLRLHLMSTHPLKFGMRKEMAPVPDEKDEKAYAMHCEKLSGFYDDAIISSDRYFGEIIETLKKAGKMENTLIIYLSDHWRKHLNESAVDRVKYPLPLIVHLPDQKEDIWFDEPVQLLDIAPSILSFLDQPIPEWMEGKIIFGGTVDTSALTARPIIATADEYAEDFEERRPPFYGIDMFSLISNNRCYVYSNLTSSGSLFDIGENSHSFHLSNNPELRSQYHKLLRDSLKAKGIVLRETLQ